MSLLSVWCNLWSYLLSWRRLLLLRRAAEARAAPLHTSLRRKSTLQIQPSSCSCIFAATQPEGEVICDNTNVWANMTQLDYSLATIQPSSSSAAWLLWADDHRAGEPAENISKSTTETLQACSSVRMLHSGMEPIRDQTQLWGDRGWRRVSTGFFLSQCNCWCNFQLNVFSPNCTTVGLSPFLSSPK